MADRNPWDLIIIGAGMAGLSTAIWARRLGLSALVLEREQQPGGQLTAIRGRIVDYPGLDLPEGAALTERILRQAREAGAELRPDWEAQAVDAAGLTCEATNGQVTGRAMVIATGLTARRLGVDGEEELYRHRLVRRPSHDMAWFRSKRVVVIGGGDRAVENALMLAATASQVTLLHRGPQLRARAPLAAPLRAHPQVELRLNTSVTRFAVADGRARIAARSGSTPVELEADAVCIYIGNRPNSGLVQGQVELDSEGYIVTDRYGRTSVPHLYAVGDVCTPPSFQSLATAAGQAMVAAKQIALEL
ncbi:MAG: NAD(P)/FAD-dependent oxidoreductase [Bacillota bacterium]